MKSCYSKFPFAFVLNLYPHWFRLLNFHLLFCAKNLLSFLPSHHSHSTSSFSGSVSFRGREGYKIDGEKWCKSFFYYFLAAYFVNVSVLIVLRDPFTTICQSLQFLRKKCGRVVLHPITKNNHAHVRVDLLPSCSYLPK